MIALERIKADIAESLSTQFCGRPVNEIGWNWSSQMFGHSGQSIFHFVDVDVRNPDRFHAIVTIQTSETLNRQHTAKVAR